MKRCPECRRDYYDETLLYCLEDGTALVQGSVPATPEGAVEPATVILHETGPPNEAQTRAQIHTTEQTDALPAAGKSDQSTTGFDKRLLAAAIVAIALAIAAYFGYSEFTKGDEQINSIAVLPFANASGDEETEFLADGVAETLINNFTKIANLKVAARSTAFRFRGREGEPGEVGRELGVGTILTGRLSQRGDNLSVQVDLIKASDGSQIWGNRYEGKSADIVSIQQRIATDVSSQLKLKLTGAQTQQVSKTYTQNPEAYQHYLRGRYYWTKRTADDLRKGLLEFQEAAELDPGYAMAYVGLADTYVLLEEYAGVPASESLPKAQAFAQKALEMDDSLGEAHATLGLINTYMWRWAEAERELKRAIELNPNYPTAHHWYSVLLNTIDHRRDDALSEIKRAQQLDPLSGVIGINVGIVYLAKDDPKSAEVEFRRIVEFDPHWWGGHFYLGLALFELDRLEEALREFETSVELTKRSGRPLSALGHVYAVIGRRADAQEIIKELEERYAKRDAIGQSLAAVYAGLGDKDRALEWLKKDFDAHSGDLIRIGWYPPFDSLHDDPRFQDLIKRMELPD